MTAKPVNLTKVVEPRFLTLTGAPANQTAFKIIRKDGENMNLQHVSRKRIRRSESLVSVTFEEGLDAEGVALVLAEWGIDEFSIETVGARLKAVLRADAENTMDVVIPDGRVMTVLKPISNSTSEKKEIVVARMDFAKDAFPELADVTNWLKRHDIDETTVKIIPGDLATTVQRVDTQDADTRTLEVEQGVAFVILRADEASIPVKFVTVVNDSAFGAWGWGQLDFAAHIADKEFSEGIRESLSSLDEVLRHIMFYSDVPVPVRKDLVRSAANQFADYAISMMDALPGKVVVAIRFDSQKEKEVTKAVPGTLAARQDDTKSGSGQPGAAPETSATLEATPLTRADVTALVTEATSGLSAQIEALTQALAVRSEAPAAPADGAPASTDTAQTLADVVRSQTTLADAVSKMASSIERMEGSTVLRSDNGDEKNAPVAKDVFRGVFGSRSREAT